jgi:L-amino acid N-acyltransferase YncA
MTSIRSAMAQDAAVIAVIYNHYIANSTATFEQQAVDQQDIGLRIEEAASSDLPYLVVEVEGEVRGYAYASKWKGRCAYRYTVETTVYLAADACRDGLGSLLYSALFDELRARSYHAAIAGISLPNDASVALHEKFAMHKVAHFEEVGYKFGNWVDVGYWQLKLD